MVVKIPQRARSGEWQPRLDDSSKAAAINLVKFYGSSVPRPRIFSSADGAARVDPPVPVMDPFLSWANEAHWSMGGLSFKRLRFQGRIEGSVDKLRAQMEKALKSNSPKSYPTKSKGNNKRAGSVSPPPAPMASKRRRYLSLSEEEDEDEEDEEEELKNAMGEEEEEEMDTPVKPTKKKRLRKGAVRKLGDDFERVAKESDSDRTAVEVMTVVEINQGLVSKAKKGLRNGQKRNSPRLAKRIPN